MGMVSKDQAKRAKCGLTTLSRCRSKNAKLPECETCTLVKRITDIWKIIDQKPHRKCRRCGEFLPLDNFYPKKIKKKDGKVYETTETVCKMCRSVMYKEAIIDSVISPKKATK